MENLIKFTLKNFITKDNINQQNAEGEALIHKICHIENKYLLELVIKNGANINLKGKSKCTPLIISCQKNNLELVKLLLKYNAATNIHDKFFNTPLQIACKNSNIEIVKSLLENNVNINKANSYTQTPISIACLYNNLEIIKLLMEKKPDLKKGYFQVGSLLAIASRKGYLEIAKYLIARGVELDCHKYNPLMEACIHNRVDVVKLLIDSGANYKDNFVHPLHEHYPIIEVMHRDYLDVFKILYEKCENIELCIGKRITFNRFFLSIIHHNSVDILDFFLKNNIKNCKNINISLHSIVSKKGYKTFNILSKHGYDINPFVNNKTPFHVACENRNIDTINFFLDYGVDVNILKNKKITSLFTACQNNHIDVVETLLQNKNIKVDYYKDYSIENKEKNQYIDTTTPLYIACEKKNTYIVKLLLEHGANPNLDKYKICTPLLLACSKNNDNEDVIKLLLEYGADPNKVIFKNLSPLVCVAKDNKYKLVKLLLEYGAEKKINGVNIVDYQMELTLEIKEILSN